MKWFRLVSLATIVLGLALATQASANPVTVRFWGPTFTDDKSQWVGPAKLTATGFNNGVWFDAACFRSDLSVVPPLQWTANIFRGDEVPYPQDNTLIKQWVPSSTELQQAGWLYKQFHLNPKAEWTGIQEALWGIFGTAPSGNTWYDQAKAAGGAWTQENVANYYVILPTDGPTWADPNASPDSPPIDYRTIQPFITTPEPASLGLILMGSGLAAVVRRRRRKA